MKPQVELYVLLICVLKWIEQDGLYVLAFEDEVTSIFFVKDLRRGIQKVHAKVVAPRKAGAPPGPNPLRAAGGVLEGVPMDDGDGAGTARGEVPDEWRG